MVFVGYDEEAKVYRVADIEKGKVSREVVFLESLPNTFNKIKKSSKTTTWLQISNEVKLLTDAESDLEEEEHFEFFDVIDVPRSDSDKTD